MGLIVLDAGVVIAALDSDDLHHVAAVASLREALERGDRLVLPASAYAESLVGPSRRGPDAVATLDAFLDTIPIAVEPANRVIARRAAALRAARGRGLRLPDALVLATAAVVGADLVLTTDAAWLQAAYLAGSDDRAVPVDVGRGGRVVRVGRLA